LVSFPYNGPKEKQKGMTTRREFLALASLVASGAVLDKAGAKATGTPAILSENGTGEDLTQFVNIFCGTGGHGHCFPGAAVPFGAVQLSPDTGFTGWDWCSGYHHDDSVLIGFSHTHLSGRRGAEPGNR
jgi:putative alpha-1,2-mannosidase